MADNDFLDESFLEVSDRDSDELLAAGRNQNCRSDEVGHANPETGLHGIQVNSSLECDRNFSASSFTPETGVTASLPTPLSVQCSGPDFNIPTSDALAGAQQSNSEVTEENPANSFLVPVETPRVNLTGTGDIQSNPSEQSSSQRNIGRSDKRRMQKKRHRSASFGVEDSTGRKKENKRAEFFRPWNPTESDSESPLQTSKESDVNEALAQTAEEYRELRSTSSIFPQSDEMSSIEMNTESPSLGAVAAAEAVSAGEPSGIQTPSDQTGKDKPFKCGICGKIFTRKYHLRRHEYTHAGKKPFKCSTCGKEFDERNHLEKHFLVHSGEKHHECTVCPQRFRMKHHLTEHLRTHTKEKPFTCDMCDKKLAHKSSLRVHIRGHTGQEPHQCEVCRRDFGIKTNCIEHQRTENGWK